MDSVRYNSFLFFVILVLVVFSTITYGGESVILSQNGKTQAVIQTPEGTSPLVTFAAQELKAYLDKITGAQFEIKGPGAASEGGIYRIVLGDCAEAQAAGLDVNKLPPDGFYIECRDNVMFLCGRDDPKANAETPFQINAIPPFQHGTLLAVYYLLENHCGVRWLLPGEVGEYVPKKNSLSVPKLSLKEEPVMRMRTTYAPMPGDLEELLGQSAHREYNLFLTRQGYSGWAMATSHYFAYDYSVSRWFDSHPEYFALNAEGKRANKPVPGMGWGMCFSNPDLAHEIALDAICYFQGNPATSRNLPEAQFGHFGRNRESFAINPADLGVGACRCSECQKYRDAKGTYSELAWLYYTRVAEEVARVCPGKIISTWSYADYENVPNIPRKAPDNVRVYLVTRGPFDWAIENNRLEQVRRMQDWYKFSGRKMYLWVNMGLRSYRPRILAGVPSPVAKHMASWMKEIAPYIDGISLHDESASYLLEAMNTYLYYHLAWNPERDPENILADYYASAYGPAAKIICGMEEEFERIWFDKVHAPTLATKTEVWEEIYTDGRIAEFQKKMADAVKVTKGTPFEARVGIFEKYYWGAILNQKQKHMELLNLADDIRLRAARASKGKGISGNHIRNGGFEILLDNGKPDQWAEYDSKTMTLDQETQMEGKYSLKITSNVDSRMIVSSWFNDMPLKPNTKYCLSYFIKTEGVEAKTPYGGAMVLVFMKAGSNTAYPEEPFTETMGWKKVAFEFTTPVKFNEEENFAIYVGIFGATGTVWFDDIFIVEATENQ